MALTLLVALDGGGFAVATTANMAAVVSYHRTLGLTVVLSGLSIAAIAGVRIFVLLAGACGLLGLTRGLLRVASGALVMEQAAGRSGAASGVYLAGLDLGKVLGPVAGGVGVHAVGIRATYLAACVGFPALYFLLSALTRRRGGRPEPALASDS